MGRPLDPSRTDAQGVTARARGGSTSPGAPSLRPFVSVLTPFYNTVDYLEECIESVLAQDYPHFEYILLDNCSTDGSTEIAREYARRDSRIRLIEAEEFVPQLPNYNRALRQISPESRYCKIVQADDRIYAGCLSKMVALAEAHPHVGLISALRLKGDQVRNGGFPADASVLPGSEVCRLQLLESRFFFGSPTSVLYRSQVVRSRDPFFSEGSYHADTEACYEILVDWDFGFVHEVLTFSRTQEGSTFAWRESHDPYGLLDRHICVIRYADEYLSEGDAEDLRRRSRSSYYDFLAKQALLLRGRSFWRYHRKGLATVELRLEPMRLLQHLAVQMFTFAREPHRIVRRFLKGTVNRDVPSK